MTEQEIEIALTVLQRVRWLHAKAAAVYMSEGRSEDAFDARLREQETLRTMAWIKELHK